MSTSKKRSFQPSAAVTSEISSIATASSPSSSFPSPSLPSPSSVRLIEYQLHSHLLSTFENILEDEDETQANVQTFDTHQQLVEYMYQQNPKLSALKLPNDKFRVLPFRGLEHEQDKKQKINNKNQKKKSKTSHGDQDEEDEDENEDEDEEEDICEYLSNLPSKYDGVLSGGWTYGSGDQDLHYVLTYIHHSQLPHVWNHALSTEKTDADIKMVSSNDMTQICKCEGCEATAIWMCQQRKKRMDDEKKGIAKNEVTTSEDVADVISSYTGGEHANTTPCEYYLDVRTYDIYTAGESTRLLISPAGLQTVRLSSA